MTGGWCSHVHTAASPSDTLSSPYGRLALGHAAKLHLIKQQFFSFRRVFVLDLSMKKDYASHPLLLPPAYYDESTSAKLNFQVRCKD